MQLEQDDSEGKDAESDGESESEEDEDIDLDTPLPPRAIAFEIDADIDITSHALRDMVAVDQSVKQSAAPQASAMPRTNVQKKISAQPDWDW